MINESEDSEAETGGSGQPGEGPGDLLDQPGVIQVSPQDKEAIERVRNNFDNLFIIMVIFSLKHWVSPNTWLSRPTSLVKKMKIWPPTFFCHRTSMINFF